MAKRTNWNRESNKRLKEKFKRMGITWCELNLEGCTYNYGLSWCHKKKRRHYLSVEELSDFSEVVCACLHCHELVENNEELRLKKFKELRG